MESDLPLADRRCGTIGEPSRLLNEAEWLACRNLTSLIRTIDPRRFDRKLRLFAVACCRMVSDRIRDPDALPLLDLIEQSADAPVDPETLRVVWERVPHYPHAEGAVKQAAAFACASWQASASCYLGAAVNAQSDSADFAHENAEESARENFSVRGRAQSTQIAILRDVVGNPFRLPEFNATWRTSTVTAIARQIYESRDFTCIPLLADALQDAGCEDTFILDHCRSDSLHVRGCWVVDLILEKP